jgi:methionyl-tRNA formyltransferase
MRVVFCGSGVFAVASLQAIMGSGRHELVGVITQPARPSGRGGVLARTPVAQAAAAAGHAVLEIDKINTPAAMEAIAAMRGDVMAVADFGQFIRAPVRDLFRWRAFNLHGSLLPALRGAAPVNWAIIRGLSRTGVTTFDLVDKMDAGPMYLTADTEITPTETAAELRLRLAELGAQLVLKTLDAMAAGTLAGVAQDESAATLAPKLTKADGIVDWSADAEAIRCRVNGTWPWPGCHMVFHGSRHADVPVVLARAASAAGGPPGEGGTLDFVPHDGGRELMVATGSGRLRVMQLQPAGKRLMDWKDFVNGYRVATGDRFVAPPAAGAGEANGSP